MLATTPPAPAADDADPPSSPDGAAAAATEAATPFSPTKPEGEGSGGGGVRLSKLLDCAYELRPEDVYAVTHVWGVEATPALLIVATDTLYLLPRHTAGPPTPSGLATAVADADAPARAPAADAAADFAFATAGGCALTPAEGAAFSWWAASEVREAVKRRWRLQPWAVQLLFVDGASLFVEVPAGEGARNGLHARLNGMLPRRTSDDESRPLEGGQAEARSFVPSLFSSGATSQLTEAWQHGRSTTFEYLIGLNGVAGRCYDDLMQYPVFPWVLRQYADEPLDFREGSHFRQLGKPMGAQAEGRAAQFRKRHAEWEDTTGEVPPFHYGTHFSSAAATSLYLLRLEPFGGYHQALQDGRFDLADRLFHSVAEEWGVASGERGSDTGCVKELVPELFYLPEALYNVNGLALGVRQDGAPLSHVVLPPWARGSGWRFVRLMRQALESAHASRNLPGWIDLVFGCLQQGEGAVDALNVFYYCTYVGAVDLSAQPEASRAALLSQIAHFGQSPEQLWRERPHPKRDKSAALSASHTVPALAALALLAAGHSLRAVAEARLAAAVTSLALTAGGDRAIALGSRCALVPGASLLLRWGYPDGSLRLLSTKSGGAASTALIAHGVAAAPITTVAVAADGALVAVGDASGGLGVWRLARAASAPSAAAAGGIGAIGAGGGGGGGRPTLTLRGRLSAHRSAVVAAAVCASQQLIASACAAGELLLHDARLLLLTHALQAHPPPAAGLRAGPGTRAAGGVVALCVREETGEVGVATASQLQLWSPNGSLLAVSDAPLRGGNAVATLAFAPTPSGSSSSCPSSPRATPTAPSGGGSSASRRRRCRRPPPTPSRARCRRCPSAAL